MRKTETQMLRCRNVDIVTCRNIVSTNRAFVSLDPQKILCIILDASQKAIQIEREEKINSCLLDRNEKLRYQSEQ